MNKYALTPAADADLEEIWQFVSTSSSIAAADRLEAELHEAMTRIGEFPDIGHTRVDLADESLKVIGVHRILIVYRPQTRSIQVIRVLHGARDFGSIFGTGPIG